MGLAHLYLICTALSSAIHHSSTPRLLSRSLFPDPLFLPHNRSKPTPSHTHRHLFCFQPSNPPDQPRQKNAPPPLQLSDLSHYIALQHLTKQFTPQVCLPSRVPGQYCLPDSRFTMSDQPHTRSTPPRGLGVSPFSHCCPRLAGRAVHMADPCAVPVLSLDGTARQVWPAAMGLWFFESELFRAHPDSDKIREGDSMKIFFHFTGCWSLSIHPPTASNRFLSLVTFHHLPAATTEQPPHTQSATEPILAHDTRYPPRHPPRPSPAPIPRTNPAL